METSLEEAKEIIRKINKISINLKIETLNLSYGEIEKLKNFLKSKGFKVNYKNGNINASKTLSKK
ncbi:MAG: hypothetical protein QXQ14_02065 [Candidatus Aenigmatarchaeota archaeon]